MRDMKFGQYLKLLKASSSSTEDTCAKKGVNGTTIGVPVLNGDEENKAQVVAYFDLDRTLIDGYSLTALAMQHLVNGEISPPRLIRLSIMFFKYFLGRIDYDQMLRSTVDDIQGMPEEELQRLGEQAFQQRLMDTIYAEGFELINTHKHLGHEVVMVTAATSYQAQPIARVLGIDHICCTVLEIREGKVGGVVNTCYGQGKVDAAVTYAEQVNADLNKAYFYSDSKEDLPLLELVGNPVIVNPKAELKKMGEACGWPILQFFQKGLNSSATHITQRAT